MPATTRRTAAAGRAQATGAGRAAARRNHVDDGLSAVPVAGPERGYLRQFFSAVPEAEVSGPICTPDNTTLVLIQAEGGGRVGMAG